jgi:hypothetical protein
VQLVRIGLFGQDRGSNPRTPPGLCLRRS